MAKAKKEDKIKWIENLLEQYEPYCFKLFSELEESSEQEEIITIDRATENKSQTSERDFKHVKELKKSLLNVYTEFKSIFANRKRFPQKQSILKKTILAIKNNLSLSQFETLLFLYEFVSIDKAKDKRSKTFWYYFRDGLLKHELEIDLTDEEVKEILTPKNYAIVSRTQKDSLFFNSNKVDNDKIGSFDDSGNPIQKIPETFFEFSRLKLNVDQWRFYFKYQTLLNKQNKTSGITIHKWSELFPNNKNFIESKNNFLKLTPSFSDQKFDLVLFKDGYTYFRKVAWLYDFFFVKNGHETKEDSKSFDHLSIFHHPILGKSYEVGGVRYINTSMIDDIEKVLPYFDLERLQEFYIEFGIYLHTHEWKGDNIKRNFDNLIDELNLRKTLKKQGRKMITNKLVIVCEIFKKAGYLLSYNIDKTCFFTLNKQKIYHLTTQ